MDSIHPHQQIDTVVHSNLKRLSHSAQVLLEACPRKYELDRLSPTRNQEGEDVHLDFGTLVGKLVQNYLVTDSIADATFEAFLAYPRALFSEEGDLDWDKEKTSKKDFWYALIALDRFTSVRQQDFGSYTVPLLDGKPAVELGFTIDCGDGFHYRGKLDAFLQHKTSGAIAVMEGKTTGSNSIHEAMFRNSGQGIGYSAIVDAVASRLGLVQPASFPVFYPIYQSGKKEWTVMRFLKTKTAHANWIRHLLRNIQHIAEYAEDSYFPAYGQNCFSYAKPCRFYEQCEMQNKYLVGPEPAIKVDKEEDYPFRFSLAEIVAAQMEKMDAATGEANP